jgi:Mg-chelatase subunit ChlD
MKLSRSVSRLAAGLAIALVCANGWAAPVLAQSPTITLDVPKDACDSDNYPSVTCVVSIVNGAGVPLRDVAAGSWEVTDGGQPARDLKVEQIENAKVAASYMLVVDFGMTQRGQVQLPQLRDAARNILQAAGDGDRVGLVAITGKVDNVDGSKLDGAKEAALVPAGSRRNEVINIITQLSPVSGTPLYDGVCKAVAVLDKDTTPGARALIVLSDGNDARSSVCDANAAITRAKDKRIPVFTIGVGPNVDTRFMQLLALQTDGQYLAEPNVQAVQERYKQIQSILRTRYKISFTAATPADSASKDAAPAHQVSLKVRAQNATLTGQAAYQALYPRKPSIEKLSFKVGGEMVNANSLPAGKDITLEPEIKVRDGKLARMEYAVDGQPPIVVAQAPYSVTLPAGLPGGPHKVVMTAVADPANPDLNFTTPAIDFGVTQVIAPTPTPTPPPLGQFCVSGTCVSSYALVGVGVALLAALALALFLVLGRRKKAVPADGFTMVSAPEDAYVPSSPTDLGQADGRTEIFADPLAGSTGGQTQIMPALTQVFTPPKFRLEIASGPDKGKEYAIGMAGVDVLVGREVDPSTGVRLNSSYVSRTHARIYMQGDAVYLEDKKSASGTRVNGTRVDPSAPVELKDKDRLDFADVQAVVKTP